MPEDMRSKASGRANGYRAGRWWLRLPALLSLLLALSLVACGGDEEDEGGIIGTGLQVPSPGAPDSPELRGTVPVERMLASATIEVRAASGERSSGSIQANGQFQVSSLAGQGPWLMQVDLGNSTAFYAIAHPDSDGVIDENVHGYSDLAARNWFARRGLDIDTVFLDTGVIDSLPTVDTYTRLTDRVQQLVQASLDTNRLIGIDLFSVAFESNDTGVDRFLDENPVLIDNGFFSIIISEPDTSTRSVVSNALPIDTDLTGDDRSPPTAPEGLRVLPSASNEIVVVWESANDNIGVVNYEVQRDGTTIATTPYPVYIDSNLPSAGPFTYTIAAVDVAGNRSEPSLPGSSQTLGTPDVTAPPAPTGLELEADLTSIDLRWLQTVIGDVASFRVLRGVNGGALEPLARVTSTFTTDAGLNSGTQYCYRIIATDASDNDSPPSAQQCISTTGSAVLVQSAADAGSAALAPAAQALQAVDVASLACTAQLDSAQGLINAAVTLDQPCYEVTRGLQVGEGGQLTIAPGTVLKFAPGTGLTVTPGGTMIARGTPTAPVVFSGLERTPGSWSGIDYVFSERATNVLEQVVIEYAGSTAGEAAALTADTDAASGVRLSLSNVLIRAGGGYAFDFEPNTVLENFSGVVATGNARSGIVAIDNVDALTSLNSYAGNDSDGVRIVGNVETAAVWNRIDAPYRLGAVQVNAPLTIAPGNTVQFERGGGLFVQPTGSLSAVGTGDSPILFTGDLATPGYWAGIHLNFSAASANRLEHVIVEAAGSDSGLAGALTTSTGSEQPSRIALRDVVFRSNLGAGLALDSETSLTQFDNIVSTGNGWPASLHGAALPSFGTTLDFSGNSDDAVRLADTVIRQPLVWPALNVPYRFGIIDVEAALTLLPGTRFEASQGARFRVTQQGSLVARGSAEAPISFVGQVPTPGHWLGLIVNNSNSPANQLEHVLLADAGLAAAGPATTGGALSMSCSGAQPAQLALSDTRIENSAGWGITLQSSNCSLLLGAAVSFSGNALGDIDRR